ARRFRGHGELGYIISIFLGLARLHRRPFPVRADGDREFCLRRCLFFQFKNSKYRGGTMMIAPQAEVNSGLIEYVRWGAIGRLGLMRNLPKLYDGTHIKHPLAERQSVKRVEFDLNAPVDVMVDGEVLTLHCEELDVLPGALNVVAFGRDIRSELCGEGIMSEERRKRQLERVGEPGSTSPSRERLIWAGIVAVLIVAYAGFWYHNNH